MASQTNGNTGLPRIKSRRKFGLCNEHTSLWMLTPAHCAMSSKHLVRRAGPPPAASRSSFMLAACSMRFKRIHVLDYELILCATLVATRRSHSKRVCDLFGTARGCYQGQQVFKLPSVSITQPLILILHQLLRTGWLGALWHSFDVDTRININSNLSWTAHPGKHLLRTS